MAIVLSAKSLPLLHATADGVSSALIAYMLRPVGRMSGLRTGSPPDVGAIKPPLSALTTDDNSACGLLRSASRYTSMLRNARSTSIMGVANCLCASVMPVCFMPGCPDTAPRRQVADLLLMAASIFLSASSSAPILRAISRAFSGDMPGSMPCFRVAGRSAILEVFSCRAGIMAAMTIIRDSMSLEPSTAAMTVRALSRSA